MQDQLTGYRKNSYGVAGMCVTNNPNTRKNTKVSDEMKQRVFNSVKDVFYKYNEMVHGRLYVIREMKLF